MKIDNNDNKNNNFSQNLKNIFTDKKTRLLPVALIAMIAVTVILNIISK